MAIVNNAKTARTGKLPSLDQILMAQATFKNGPQVAAPPVAPAGSLQQQVQQAMRGGVPTGTAMQASGGLRPGDVPQLPRAAQAPVAQGLDLSASRGATTTPVSTAARGATGGAASLADDIAGLGNTRGTVGPVSQFPQAAAQGGGRLAGLKNAIPGASRIANMSPMMKAGGAAIGGQLAGSFVDDMDIGGENSNLDQFLSGGIKGAGAGAAAAMLMGGPAGWGALAGGLGYGAFKSFFGDDETSAEKMANQVSEFNMMTQEMASGLGVRPDVLEETLLPINLQIQMAMESGDKDMLKQTVEAARQNLPTLIQNAYGQSQVKQQEEDRYARMIANQAQFAPMFENAIERSSLASQQSMQYSNDLADQLDASAPGLSDMIRSTAARSNASSEALMAAYAGQIAMQPQVTADSNLLAERTAQQELLSQYMAGAV